MIPYQPSIASTTVQGISTECNCNRPRIPLHSIQRSLGARPAQHNSNPFTSQFHKPRASNNSLSPYLPTGYEPKHFLKLEQLQRDFNNDGTLEQHNRRRLEQPRRDIEDGSALEQHIDLDLGLAQLQGSIESDSALEQHTDLSGLFDELTFDPGEQELSPMEVLSDEPAEAAAMNMIAQLQHELREVRDQLNRSNSVLDVSMHTAPPSPKKPKIKDLRCTTFKGTEVYTGLGAGFEHFLSEFEHALPTEQLVNGSTWTDALKASVIVNFLEGKASRHYHKKNCEWQLRHEGTMMPYDHVKKIMLSEFGCKLGPLELDSRLRCPKRPGDSWSDYLDYLKFIEGLMVEDHSRLVLDIFCQKACPELAATLLSRIDPLNCDYCAETDRAMALLYNLKGDGRCPAAQKSRPQESKWKGHHQQQRVDKAPHYYTRNPTSPRRATDYGSREHGEGHAAIGSRALCFVCGDPKHKVSACPYMAKAKELAKTASANIAENTQRKTAATPNDGHLWLAESGQSLNEDDSDNQSTNGDHDGHVWIVDGCAEAETVNQKVLVSTKPGKNWLIDSGATHHLCGNRSLLFGVTSAHLNIRVANGNFMTATEKGNCVITTSVKGELRQLVLTDVYYVENLSRNLVLVRALSKQGHSCRFQRDCFITDSEGLDVGLVKLSKGLWELKPVEDVPEALYAHVSSGTLQSWHERLGHLNFQDLLRMVDKGLANNIKLANRRAQFCLSCSDAKQTKRRQPQEDTSTSAPTDEIGATLSVDLKTDLPPDRRGNIHLLSIIDHASNYNQAYLLRRKKDAAGRIEDFICEFEKQFGMPVKVLRSDGGGEFGSASLHRFLRNRGIRRQETEADTSASNGKAERHHRTLMDSSRAMLWASSLPERFWGDAVVYASYIRNRLPTRANADHKSPLETLTGKAPSVDHILRFGSTCTMHTPHKTSTSLRKRAERAIVLGVSPTKKAYVLYVPRKKKCEVSGSVQNIERLDPVPVADFFDGSESEGKLEHDSIGLSARQLRSVFGSLKSTLDSSDEKEFELPASFHKEFATPAVAFMTATINPTGGVNLALSDDQQDRPSVIISEKDNIQEPKSFKEAMNSVYWREWSAAIQEELSAISENATWEIVEAPPDANIITGKWVFKLKFGSAGELERFKARLVARGFAQKFGVDYHATFAPVLKITSLRLLIVLAAIWHVLIRQGDVPIAYLRAGLDTPIFMRPPPGLKLPKGLVLLLKKGLYGLKQSGKLWNELMNKFLLSRGYQRSNLDACLYFRRNEKDQLSVLGLYVDDILVVSEDTNDSEWIMAELGREFNVKDLGVAEKCLGLHLEQNASGIFLHQRNNIDAILRRTGMENCHPVKTPLENLKNYEDLTSPPFLDTQLMREIVGSLLWLSNSTRPDITMPVNYLARFVSRPTEAHWRGIKRVLRYLRGTNTVGLYFKQSPNKGISLKPTVYSDADWAGDSTNAKSVSGGLLTINGMIVDWFSKKQTCVALSTAEAEYVAGAMAVNDCLWIQQLLVEMKLIADSTPTQLRVDNQSAIVTMENDISSARMKHVNIKFHFIRDYVNDGTIAVSYCPTTEMKADILTKPLLATRHLQLMKMLHLTSPINDKTDTHE